VKVRLRLTLLVMLGLVAAGSVALAVNAFVYQDSIYKTQQDFTAALLSEIGVSKQDAEAYVRAHPDAVFDTKYSDVPGPGGRPSVNAAFQALQRRSQRDAIRQSRYWTALAIGALAGVAGAIGWFVSGRALKPLRLVTMRARAAAAGDLSGRLALSGPHDELKALADTFDEMLERLERSFVAQRQFSGQASHELRTPLSVIHSETDILLSDAHDESVRGPIENIRTATIRSERIVTGLLALARSQSGNVEPRPISFDELVGDVVAEVAQASPWRGLRLDVELHPVTILGDRALIECLVRNLVDNAAEHNGEGGWVNISVGTGSRGAVRCGVLRIANSTSMTASPADGPPRSRGHRIGLTVVQAILEAHGGSLDQAPPERDTFAVAAYLPATDVQHELSTVSATSTDSADVSPKLRITQS
jgi:signal transduction histidine kinase